MLRLDLPGLSLANKPFELFPYLLLFCLHFRLLCLLARRQQGRNTRERGERRVWAALGPTLVQRSARVFATLKAATLLALGPAVIMLDMPFLC